MNALKLPFAIFLLWATIFSAYRSAVTQRMWAPREAVLASGWQAATPGGIRVKLVAISDSLLGYPDKVWGPDGGEVGVTGPSPFHSPLKKVDPSLRELFFEIDGGLSVPPSRTGARPTSDSQLAEVFIAGIAASQIEGRTMNGQPGIGLGDPAMGWLAQNANTPITVYSNRMKVSDLVLAVADGPFAKIESFPNTLSGPYLGKTLGEHAWGTAKVTEYPWDDPNVAHFQTRPAFAKLQIEPKSAPAPDQIQVVGYDEAGKPITNCWGSIVGVQAMLLPRIKRWEVRTRPFQFILFKGVHFDPN